MIKITPETTKIFNSQLILVEIKPKFDQLMNCNRTTPISNTTTDTSAEGKEGINVPNKSLPLKHFFNATTNHYWVRFPNFGCATKPNCLSTLKFFSQKIEQILAKKTIPLSRIN